MSIRWSAVLTFVGFLVVFGALIQAGPNSWGDLTVRALGGGVFGAISCYAVVRLARGEPHTMDPSVGFPAALRRWLIGESPKG